MGTVLLKAETGRQKGSAASRRLRRAGKVPAVLYGMNREPLSVSVKLQDLRYALTGKSNLNVALALEVDGEKHLCIVKELQSHPVRSEVLHVDFTRIDPSKEIEVTVPLVLTGEAKKVTQASGMVDQVMHSLPVKARIDNIPAQVTADVSRLEIGASLRVADIELPEGVTSAGDPGALFAVGLITRSTKEYLRQLKVQEDDLEVVTEEDAADAGVSDDE